MRRNKIATSFEFAEVLDFIASQGTRSSALIVARSTPDTNEVKPNLCASKAATVSQVEWPLRTTLLLRALRAAIEGSIGHQLSFDELSYITGEAKSTLSNWFAGEGNPSMETMLRLIERVPVAQRHHVLDLPPITRCYPTLSHPRLSHDPVAVSQLRAILTQSTGTTVVHSARAELVTFAVAALGHTYYNLNPRAQAIRGLSAHRPDWFIQVPGVDHLNNIQSPEKVRTEIASKWSSLIEVKAGLFLFNGLWVVNDNYFSLQ